MFPFSEVLPDIDSRLDAEGSDHYGLVEDKLTAGTMAALFIVNRANRVEGVNKFAEEALRDLTLTRVWEPSSTYGRLQFNEAALGHEMLSIVAVMPDPEWPAGQTVVGTVFANGYTSRLRTDLSFFRSKGNAKRYSREQRDRVAKNKFMKGNEVLKGNSELVTYGYINASDYDSTQPYTTATPEIEVFPIPPLQTTPSSGRYVAVEYVRVPAKLTQVGSIVELPDSLKDLFISKTLSYIAVKQGDGTNLVSLAEKDVQDQMNLLGW